MHSLPCASKQRAPIELDLEKLTVSSRKKKKLQLPRWNVIVILCFTCLLHNNCTAVLGRQPKVVAKQTITEGSCRRTDKINSVELHVQHADYLVSFPVYYNWKVFFHAQHFFISIQHFSTALFTMKTRIFIDFSWKIQNLGDVSRFVEDGSFSFPRAFRNF